jgi:hypothetical protein
MWKNTFMKKKIKPLLKKLKLLPNYLLNDLLKTEFLGTHIITLWLFCILYFDKESFYESYKEDSVLTIWHITILYYSLLTFLTCMLMYTLHLIIYSHGIKRMEIEFTKKSFETFIEHEYSYHKKPFFEWIWYFIMMLVSGIAIYVSLISMQSSIDIAKSNWWDVNLEATSSMFYSLWSGLSLTLFIFIFCFFWYKFSLNSKVTYIEKLHHKKFFKKSFKN